MNTISPQCCSGATTILKCSCDANTLTATTCQDTINIGITCATFTIVAIYGIYRFFKYKTKEQEDKKTIEQNKRTWEVEDIERKQKATLLDKELQILYDTCYENKDKDVKKTVKPHNSEEITKYLNVIHKAIGINYIDKQPASNENKDPQQI